MARQSFFSGKLFAWWDDLNGTAGQTGGRIPVLDGVRGLATLIVLASHTSFLGLWSQGSVGVWLFFSLSGLLLSQPFLKEQAVTPKRYVEFLFNRCRRILPAYWVATLVFYIPVSGLELSNLLPNLLMVRSDWHLWSIKQEMILYAILPFIFALLPLFRGCLVLFAAFIAIIGVVLHLFGGPDVFVTDYGRQLRLYVLPFLLGIAVGTLYQSPRFRDLAAHRLASSVSSAGLVLFVALLFASAPHVFEPILKTLLGQVTAGDPPGWKYPGFFSFACAVFLLCSLLPGRLTKAVLTWPPLRACGMLGYSIYLIHYFVILILPKSLPLGWPMFAVTLAITFPLACALYGFVERTFWGSRSSSSVPVQSAHQLLKRTKAT